MTAANLTRDVAAHSEVVTKKPSGLVILVDADPAFRKLYSQRLRTLGFTVATARDGSEAMSLLYKIVPKILILNVVLPDIDGIDLCRRVREYHGYQVTIIFLSTIENLEMVQLCLEAGGNDYLIKSENLDKLAERTLFWANVSRQSRQEEYRTLSLAAIRSAIQVREAEIQADQDPGLTSDNDVDVAEISRFLAQAQQAAGENFGTSVEEKLYLLGYVAGIVNHWGTLKPHMKSRLGDYIKAVLLETKILGRQEIGILLGAWDELETAPIFAEGVGKGTYDAVARVSKGHKFNPLGLSKFAQSGETSGSPGQLSEKVRGTER